MGDELLNNDDIVRGSPIRKESSLDFTNEKGKMGFYSIGYDLCNDLIVGITKANGPEILEGCSIPTFRDEIKIGGIDSRVHSLGVKGVHNKFL